MKADTRINIFIASSSEALPVAQAIQTELQERNRNYFIEIWNQSVIPAGRYVTPELRKKISAQAFVIFVFAPDDKLRCRNHTYKITRDNVILELGMAIGILGEQRCFVFQEKDVKMPSDLYGFTTIHYDSQYINDNPRTAIGPAVSKFEQSIAGFREELVYASWESYWKNVKKLHQQLSLSPSQGGFRYDLLIGISRGGCAVADLLCRQDGGRLPILCMMPSYGNSKQQTVCFDNAFDAAQFALIETFDYQNILIVDDISRTGGTLCNLKTALEQRFPDRNVKCAALYVGAHCKNKLDYCVEETQLDLMLSMPYSR